MIRLAVLGHPISHSRSPAMHNAAMAALGLEGVYRAIDITEPGMSRFADAIRRGLVLGANITMPHKAAASHLADRVEPDAAQADSVNTWFREGTQLIGASTDISGLLGVCDRRGIAADTPVLIVGAGGAARAAAVAFADRDLLVTARSATSAADLLESCGLKGRVIDWGEATEGVVVVNCTPLGMTGEVLPPAITDAPSAVIDMAYGMSDTPLIARAKSGRIPYADGIDVLVAQAGVSFALWLGVEPPLDVMEHAARNASRG